MLQEVENAKLTVGDNLWFFFSGHGTIDNGQDCLKYARINKQRH
ncbi:MAG: hypothetical protein SAJ12_10175 [Jaaginema sp. PMC 1079.18]|nr:hypothetical protein [Jaaginema sp. PMC 1080.18]MEC4851366.1 hypothetical protein [Jaaginema sp. PMC 1079.18]MEC4865364.1 hypothetical protein [Jaaginema sp. PMC 1078.18]